MGAALLCGKKDAVTWEVDVKKPEEGELLRAFFETYSLTTF
ncbi:MAG: hypothetical protein ACI8PB_003621 [Desulforhopalus sp.]|jgi:hypothetical protein